MGWASLFACQSLSPWLRPGGGFPPPRGVPLSLPFCGKPQKKGIAIIALLGENHLFAPCARWALRASPVPGLGGAAAPPLFRARVFGGWRFVSGTASRPVEPAAPTLRWRPALPAWVVPLQSAQGAAVCCGGAVALRCSWPAAASLAPKALRATRCSPYCRHCPSLPMGNNWALTPVKFVPITLNSCLNARRALVGCAPSLAQIPPRRYAPAGVFR